MARRGSRSEMTQDEVSLYNVAQIWGDTDPYKRLRAPNCKANATLDNFLIKPDGSIGLVLEFQGPDPEDPTVEQTYKETKWYNMTDSAGQPNLKSVGYLKADMAMTNFDPPKKSAKKEEVVERVLAWKSHLSKPTVIAITVKQNGDFTNIYINGIVA